MSATNLLGEKTSSASENISFRGNANEETVWMDRLEDCNRRIRKLKATLNLALAVQAKKWDSFVLKPLEIRQSMRQTPPVKKPNVCSSTPISLATKPLTLPDAAAPLDSAISLGNPPNRLKLCDIYNSTETDRAEEWHYDLDAIVETNGEQNDEPADGFGFRSFEQLDPNAFREAIGCDKMIPETKSCP
ncbi:uncharacterized protein LOC100898276 [Galendromus occidentalis]|uniref:Uncharacterized protein LOC100898276 n=1 Tax=Galendromus occidentalis TaxID=34638 RepID=A0AAJ6QUZ5_9ACAR|nr:uncharacterized protein LOC100898276 [Galendromus occidentalis]